MEVQVITDFLLRHPELKLCALGFGVVKALKDLSSEDRFLSDYLNKTPGSERKYYHDEKGKKVRNTKKRWYYLWVYTPKYKEKFLYSTLILVFLTDFWHLMELFYTKGFTIYAFVHPVEIVPYKFMADTILYGFIQSFGFHLVYSNKYKTYLANRKRQHLNNIRK